MKTKGISYPNKRAAQRKLSCHCFSSVEAAEAFRSTGCDKALMIYNVIKCECCSVAAS